MLKLGIVGLPNVGKSSLFNALTAAGAAAENYPFCTVEPNVGMVEVPDPRLDRIADIVQPKKTVPAVVQFVDIAGLVKGAAEGEGLGNKFLSTIRETDFLKEGRGLWEADFTKEQLELLRPLTLLTVKPILYAANVTEHELTGDEGKHLRALREAVAKSHEPAEVVPFSAKIEAELSELSGEERTEFLHHLGIESAGLDRLIHAGYHLLGLHTFFTAAEKEARAWTIHQGETAPQAAGTIHTDFERGFIRAETVSYDDFAASGGWKGAREKGAVRAEGRDYVVKDGDVMLFRFNV